MITTTIIMAALGVVLATVLVTGGWLITAMSLDNGRSDRHYFSRSVPVASKVFAVGSIVFAWATILFVLDAAGAVTL